MNKARRKRISDAIEKIAEARQELDEICTEEQEGYDNLPEGIQMSENGEKMQNAIDSLTEVDSNLDDALNTLDSI